MAKKSGKMAALTAEIDALRRVNMSLVERMLVLAAQPPVVIPPPDTSEIIKAVAELVNGWRTVSEQPLPTPPVGFDLDADKENIDEFVPPWENMGAEMMGVRPGWVNPPTNGQYTPYIPGQGNVATPEGGVE